MLSAREFDTVSETSSDEKEVDITYRSAVSGNTKFLTSVHDKPPPPVSATKKAFPKASTRGHRYTVSIATIDSLITYNAGEGHFPMLSESVNFGQSPYITDKRQLLIDHDTLCE